MAFSREVLISFFLGNSSLALLVADDFLGGGFGSPSWQLVQPQALFNSFDNYESYVPKVSAFRFILTSMVAPRNMLFIVDQSAHSTYA